MIFNIDSLSRYAITILTETNVTGEATVQRTKPEQTSMLLTAGIALAALACMLGCNRNPNVYCIACHTDREVLQKLADPVEYPPDTGEG